MLDALAGDDARRLLEALPERDALDERLATAILDAAEGVPLFLEQLAAHAAESDLADEGIPTSLDALLASRIDALEPGERAVLSRAAVVGRTFSRESLGALTPDRETRELAGRLASLGRRRLVRTRGDDHVFAHPLVRSAADGAIARPERAALHETFARWLDGRDESDELIGTHLERAARDAGDLARRAALSLEASAWLGEAGQRALLSFDYAAAANLLERAAALLDDEALDRMEIECRLGHALKGVGRLGEAIDLLEATAVRARDAGHRPIELRARVELIHPVLAGGPLTADEAAALLDEALVVFRQATMCSGSPAPKRHTCSSTTGTRAPTPLSCTQSVRTPRIGASGAAVRWMPRPSSSPCALGPRPCERRHARASAALPGTRTVPGCARTFSSTSESSAP